MNRLNRFARNVALLSGLVMAWPAVGAGTPPQPAVTSGAQNDATSRTASYGNIDLLHAFASDSLTAHLLMTEVAGLTAEDRSLADRLLARRYSLDDPGLAAARAEIRDSLADGPDWSTLATAFRRGMTTADARCATEALDAYIAGDVDRALARAAALSNGGRKRPSVTALQVMALGERAATSFRAGRIPATRDAVRHLSLLLPTSDKVHAALAQLDVPRSSPPGTPVPTPSPVAKPIQAPVKDEPKPMPPDAKRAWAFYHEAVDRNVSDYERVEILESMRVRFGETEAPAINKELKRVRARIRRNATKSGTN